jgi:polysaccharide deacetylase 2 family uncharacterized protein YibQ
MAKRKTPGTPGSQARSRSVLVLVLVFVLFLIALDYVGWLGGLRSNIFTLILGKHVAPNQTDLYKLITGMLSDQGIKKRSVGGFVDRDKVLHLKVELPLAKYRLLTGPLAKKLADSGARIASLDTSQEEDRIFFLWFLEGREKEKLALLFSCSQPAAPKKPQPLKPELVQPMPSLQLQPPSQKYAALIIDDLGNSLEAARDICSLGLPVTVAILPFTPHATETAQLAHECGLEVILHMPMESLGNHYTEKNTPGLLRTTMNDTDLGRTAEDCLAQVPYIRGLNNHMGSKMTEDAHAMSLVFKAMQGKNLYFIDSRTSARSVAVELARTMGIPSGMCNLFIDPDQDGQTGSVAEIKGNFLGLLRLAQKQGLAVGIGHPRPATISAIKECLGAVRDSGVSFVFASRVAKK